MRSCSRRFIPARRFSERSELRVTFLLVFVASLNASMVAARARSEMPKAIINSISENPDCFFMVSILPPSSRKCRDIADERISVLNAAEVVIDGDGDLPESRCSGNGRDGDC